MRGSRQQSKENVLLFYIEDFYLSGRWLAAFDMAYGDEAGKHLAFEAFVSSGFHLAYNSIEIFAPPTNTNSYWRPT